MASTRRVAACAALAVAVACMLQGCGDPEPSVEASEEGASSPRRTSTTTTLAPKPVLRCADSGSGCSGVKALHLCGAVGSTFCRKTCELCAEGSEDDGESSGASTTSAPSRPIPGGDDGEGCHDIGTGCGSVESLGLCSTVGQLFCKSTCGHCGADSATTTPASVDDGKRPTTSPVVRGDCEDRGSGCSGIKQFGLCSTLGTLFCKETCELCEGADDGDASTTSASPATTHLAVNESSADATTQVAPTGAASGSPSASTTTVRPPAVTPTRATSLRTTTGSPDDEECEDVGTGCETTLEWGLCSTIGRLFCRDTCGHCEESGN